MKEDKPVMESVSHSEQMVSKKNVYEFWVESTNDFFSEKKTGIDISHKQDSYWKYLDLWEKEIILENLSGNLILDLGAGTGRITEYLRAKGKKVIAADFVYEALTAIKGNNGFSPKANMDVTSLGFKNSSIDCVFACRVLQSLPTMEEKEAAVSEIARVLKSGGNLILTEGNPLRVKFAPVPYNFYITIKEWTHLLNKHGFRIIRTYGIPFLTAVKVLDTVSRGLTSDLPTFAKIANILDRKFGQTFLKKLSLQHDIIAIKV